MSLRIVVHRNIPDDPKLRRQWNEVALRVERPEVFYTCEWALAMQSAHRTSLKPFLLLGYEGDDLVGVVSLATDPADRNIGFLAANTADYCEFLTAPERRADFIDAVFAELCRTGNQEMTLANLPKDSATPAALQRLGKKHGLRVFQRPAYACAQVELGVGECRQKLQAAVMRKKMLHRKLRGLERLGTVTFAHLSSRAQIQSALPEFADAHVERFKATGRVSSLATIERRCFLEDLVRQFSGSEVVTLSLMAVNGQPVAWNYGFRFRGSWFWYQPTFDSRWDEHSPGYCLLARIIIDACDMDGMKVVDLGLGTEGYKERFENGTRQTLHVTVTRSQLRHVREMLRYRTASLLKQSPRVETLIRHSLSRLQLLRRKQT